MVFLYPSILFGLFAVLIPILIHLFNLRRYRKVYFTNVQLLQQLKKETKKQSQLKHLLVLFSRILTICFLVMAFAHPTIPIDNTIQDIKKNNLVSIYIDNSFSMQAQGAEGELLSKSKSDAIEIVSAFSNSDIFNLITNDFSPYSNRTFSKEEIIDLIMNVDYSPSFKTYSEIIEKCQNISLKNYNSNKLLFFISDFQKNTFDIERSINDTGQSIFLLPQYAQIINNVFIDSCYISSPVIQSNQPIELTVVIENISDKDYEKLPLKLLVNNVQRGLTNFDISAYSKAKVSIKFQVENPGLKQCEIKISDFPVIYDDALYFSFNVLNQYNILDIYENKANKFIELLYNSDSLFSLRSLRVTSIDYSSLSLYDLIILNDISGFSSGLFNAVKKYAENGGSILILPPEELSQAYEGKISELLRINFNKADTITTEISDLNLNNILFTDIFEEIPDLQNNQKINLPYVKKYYPLTIPQRSQTEEILSLQNENPFLIESSNFKGKIYLIASPLKDNWTNFHKHALFVPLMYRMVLTNQRTGKLYYTIAENEYVDLPSGTRNNIEVLRIKQGKEFDIIPEIIKNDNKSSVNVHNNIRKAGNYTLNDGDNILSILSYNYNRNESDLSTFSELQILELISSDSLYIYLLEDTNKPFSQTIKELNEGTSLWKLFIILALVFLLVEIVIIRIWK